MLDTFVPPRKVTTGSSADSVARVNEAKFGDGYSQRSSDGLNADDQTFSGICSGIKADAADALIAFLQAHKFTPFLWAVPLDPVTRKWVYKRHSRAYLGSGLQAISFTLQEVFDL